MLVKNEASQQCEHDRITTTIEREWLAQIIAGTRPALQAGHKGFPRL
jgi:hypothetical protein